MKNSIPSERDLPADRLITMKDELMAQIDEMERHDDSGGRGVISLASRPRVRRVAAGAAAALALGLAAVVALGGDEPASASPNFAAPADDGRIRIYVEDLDDPDEVERDLAALGVPAVVDIHEGGGHACDPGRSDGWVTQPSDVLPDLVPEDGRDDGGDSVFDFRLDPEAVRPGETVAIELFWDEHDGAWATLMTVRTSTSPIGECELVEDDSVIVDAEGGVVGG